MGDLQTNIKGAKIIESLNNGLEVPQIKQKVTELSLKVKNIEEDIDVQEHYDKQIDIPITPGTSVSNKTYYDVALKKGNTYNWSVNADGAIKSSATIYFYNSDKTSVSVERSGETIVSSINALDGHSANFKCLEDISYVAFYCGGSTIVSNGVLILTIQSIDEQKGIREEINDIKKGNKRLIERLEELENNPSGAEVVDSLDSDDPTKALSAKQGKVLEEAINGVKKESKEYITLTDGRYYNTGTANVGQSFVKDGTNSGTKFSCAKINVLEGEVYELKCVGGGTNAVRTYVLVDAEGVVVERGGYTSDYREEAKIINILSDGILYYNTEYKEGDYLAKLLSIQVGGYKQYTDNAVSAIPNAVKGKTYILCGDSQVGQTGKFCEYLAELLKCDVYMCGFGGMRYADSANSTIAQSHNPFSSCGVADALVSGDFSAIAYAIETYYPTNDRYILALSNMQEVYEKINSTKGENVVLSIAYGANDYANSISLGEHGNGDRRKVIGAQEYAIETLQNKYPLMQIIIVGTPWVVTSYDETTKEILEDSDQLVKDIDGQSMHRYEYNDAILANAHNNYHLRVFDMYRNCGRNRLNIWELCSDGVHPSKTAGQKLLADIYFRIFYSL